MLIGISNNENYKIKFCLATNFYEFSNFLKGFEIFDMAEKILKPSECEDSLKIVIFRQLCQVFDDFNNKKDETENLTKLSDLIMKNLNSDDYKVKIAIVNSLDLLFKNLKKENLSQLIILIKSYIQINSEQDIKITFCKNFKNIFQQKESENLVENFITDFSVLVKDTFHVRKAFAGNILKISLQKTFFIDKIFPLFLELLKDESYEIRIEVLMDLELLNKEINISDNFDAIYPSILDISQSKSWRIRHQLKQLLNVLRCTLKESILIDKIFPIFLNWITDPVYTLRKEGAEIINMFLQEYPNTYNSIEEKINELKSSGTYLLKVTLCFLLENMVLSSKNKLIVEKKYIPLVLDLAKSDVSNVVINCEKIILNLQHIKEVKEESGFILSLIKKYKQI